MKTKLHNYENYSSNRTLESIIWIFGITMIMIMFSYASFASPVKFVDEPYIDDIPFDTELIVKKVSQIEFDFEEETYIDDIPFNTACIAADCRYKKALDVVFELSNESYIDDLPFSTAQVVEIFLFNQAVSDEFKMEEEAYISDIPFDTYEIAYSASENRKLEISSLITRSN